MNTFSQEINFRFKNTENPQISERDIEPGYTVYSFTFDVEKQEEEIQIRWDLPANDMQYLWTPGHQHGIQPLWGNRDITSYATMQAPVLSVFNNNNINKMTFALSDALNEVRMTCGVIEETAHMENWVIVHPSAFENLEQYKVELIIDLRDVPYWNSLSDISDWWASIDDYKPMQVPDIAKMPMYSTWYSFHQQLDVAEVISECKLAKQIGCEAVIVDDGWQTLDNKRGYKYTGDWIPERIPNMKAFVDSIHAIDMRFLLWYSVPFVGEASEASKQFKGKFLTKRGDAFVLDPRYPDVREYIVNTYLTALKQWGLDGFKFDFVDNFKVYPNHKQYQPENFEELSKQMDYQNVNVATDKLLTDITQTLTAEKSDILIEFRQRYIGPLMRKYGNMFRAGDCPYGLWENRLRTTNVKLIAGNTATHSDMIMWHSEESAEVAALQLLNVMFSVPQISVKMHLYPQEHFTMLNFWVPFWTEHQHVLLEGDFEAYYPNLNYPILIGKNNDTIVVGIYSPSHLIPINSEHAPKEINIMNASGQTKVVIDFIKDFGNYTYKVFDCFGNEQDNGIVKLDGVKLFKVPKAGLLRLSID